jgi:hypothetical protein
MFRSKEQKAKDKERQRFYLLPGQGGSAYHRKQRFILKAALVVGLLVSGIFALAVWWMHHSAR